MAPRDKDAVAPVGDRLGIVAGLAAREVSRDARARLPVVLATMHLSWGIGFLTSPRSLLPGGRTMGGPAGPG